MRSYQSHKYTNFNDYLREIPKNAERALMKKSLEPMIKELQKYNIEMPLDCVNIMRSFSLPRPVINEYMKRFIDSKIDNFNITSRIIKPTNAFEKNTILTYLAFISPGIMLAEFTKFISSKYRNFENKESLFLEFEKEINKIQEKKSNEIVISGFSELSTSDDDDYFYNLSN